MADQKSAPGAKAPVPYPSNWSKMSATEKRAWEQKNRGVKPRPHPVAPPKQYTPPPAPVEEQPADEQPQEQPGGADQEQPQEQEPFDPNAVKITIEIPGREPVETYPGGFLPTLLREMANHFECQRPVG